MPDQRESILARVRAALSPLPTRTPLPRYDADFAAMRERIAHRDLAELFSETIRQGEAVAYTDPGAVVERLRAGSWLHGYCDPALWPGLGRHFGPDFRVETEFDRSRVDDYAFGITRASGAIAETGTIILKDADTSRRLGSLAPWVHIAVLRRSEIFADVSQALAALGSDPYVVWCTGSSSTADVESILIRGVHGPGVQIALIEPS